MFKLPNEELITISCDRLLSFIFILSYFHSRSVTYIDNGVYKVWQGKDGLNSLSRFPSVVREVDRSDWNTEAIGRESARRMTNATEFVYMVKSQIKQKLFCFSFFDIY